MTQDQIKETLRMHGMWMRGEDGGALADLRGANLSGAAMAGSIGVIRASGSWTDHGESGRELLAVHHPAKAEEPAVTLYYCGCWQSREAIAAHTRLQSGSRVCRGGRCTSSRSPALRLGGC